LALICVCGRVGTVNDVEGLEAGFSEFAGLFQVWATLMVKFVIAFVWADAYLAIKRVGFESFKLKRAATPHDV